MTPAAPGQRSRHQRRHQTRVHRRRSLRKIGLAQARKERIAGLYGQPVGVRQHNLRQHLYAQRRPLLFPTQTFYHPTTRLRIFSHGQHVRRSQHQPQSPSQGQPPRHLPRPHDSISPTRAPPTSATPHTTPIPPAPMPPHPNARSPPPTRSPPPATPPQPALPSPPSPPPTATTQPNTSLPAPSCPAKIQKNRSADNPHPTTVPAQYPTPIARLTNPYIPTPATTAANNCPPPPGSAATPSRTSAGKTANTSAPQTAPLHTGSASTSETAPPSSPSSQISGPARIVSTRSPAHLVLRIPVGVERVRNVTRRHRQKIQRQKYLPSQ